MKRRRLFLQLAFPLLVVTLAAFGGLSWYAARNVHDHMMRRTASDLNERVVLVADEVLPRLQTLGERTARPDDSLQALVRTIGAAARMRITIVAADGTVLGDSMEDPARMDNHAHRPEIADALRSGRGEALRYSRTIERISLDIARRVGGANMPAAVVRVSVPVSWIEDAEAALRTDLLIGTAVAAALAVIVVIIIVRSLVRSVDRLREGADRFAHGDLDTRIPAGSTRELAELSDALNSMAQQLGERMGTILSQHNEQEAMLSSMVEGVLAVNADRRIITVNRALASMLAIDPAAAQGRSLEEAIRNTDLQRFAARALAGPDAVEGVITIHGHTEDRHLQAHGTQMRGSAGGVGTGHGGGDSRRGRAVAGAVIVLNDITRMRRLENIRREFVSNVSHELRTPITSIKGFVETLLHGAIDEREDALRFLGIIARQADRLGSIIEDLLSLSRIEQESERGELPREPHEVAGIIAAAVQTCSIGAAERGATLRVECDETLTAVVNAHLLEQALVNLISNAITYSDAGGEIIIHAERVADALRLSVRDFGIGIEREHLPRLFERFYRVDKARSRKLGGTGLGLAIVKHIAQAHGGTVGVESAPEHGSTFTIIIPLTPSIRDHARASAT